MNSNNNYNNLNPDDTQQQNGLFVLNHTSPIPSIQRRTTDGARHFRDNFTNVIREIEPFMESARIAGLQNAISVTSFLNRSQSSDGVLSHNHHHHHHHSLQNSMPNLDNNSFVINLEGVTNENNSPSDDNPIRAEEPPEYNTNNNNPEATTNVVDRAQLAEAQQFLQVILRYVPFICILIAKCVFDYYQSLLILFVLFFTFLHTNIVIKREATKRHRRGLGVLLTQLLYIMASFLFVRYIFADELHSFNSVINLVLIKTISHPLTVGGLLWVITLTDFILKLATVAVKVLLSMLPARIIAFRKRGKIYLFIEAVSQTYRSIVTIQPWLNFLLESYEGPQKVSAVFLSAFYMIAKGTDLMSKFKLLKTATFKLLQNVTVGSSPSKEEIQTAGEHCPICHDEYEAPVLLQCRHIFCENCVTTWFDREQTCPLCRAKIVDDPAWRDGSTSHFIQLF